MALQQTQNKPTTEKKLNDSQQCRYIGTYYILAKKNLFRSDPKLYSPYNSGKGLYFSPKLLMHYSRGKAKK